MDHEKQVRAQICQDFLQFCTIHDSLGVVNRKMCWFSVDNNDRQITLPLAHACGVIIRIFKVICVQVTSHSCGIGGRGEKSNIIFIIIHVHFSRRTI